MSTPATFEEFLPAFFQIFLHQGFRGGDFLAYLNRPATRRSGDEASVVDTAIVGPLLGLLGFAPAERVYNQQRAGDRPDFAPTDAGYGLCFIVESKNTAADLTLDLADPTSHLGQLARYVRDSAIRLGWLTNGRRLTVWRFNDPDRPRCLIDLDISAAIQEWLAGSPSPLSPPIHRALHDLFDLCHREAFTDPRRLEDEIAVSQQEWQRQALVLGAGDGSEHRLVEAVQSLVQELQRDARRHLDTALARHADYRQRAPRLANDALEPASARLDELRGKAMTALEASSVLVGLVEAEREQIGSLLVRAERDPHAFIGPKALLAEVLVTINAARQRKYAGRPRATQPWTHLGELPALREAMENYADAVVGWHQRQALLRHDYRAAIDVAESFTIWTTLLQETMLGSLNEEQRRDEFALQAAYVVFIRLLLIRVCEDKGIFPQRFISDGGLQFWQESIKRYLLFANGNPYTPLLDMAYTNAQNIYAHFFTGRELFNWYQLDRSRLMMALHRLSRFDFAGVDSDIVGTIYNTYVSRKEKREKGQYYTPPVIVDSILDTVGYTSGPAIIGSNRRLIDPACGSGTFLVTAARRLIAAYRDDQDRIRDPLAVLERVRSALYGFDLNPFACYLAEVNLLIQTLDLVKLALDAGQRPKLQRFYIYNVDALTRSIGQSFFPRFDTLLAEETDEVDRIKSRAPGTPHAAGFAFVVANPPYGAALSDTYKAALRTDWPDVFYGQPDTYVFFLKLGVELLAHGGRLGFITPNTYLMGTNTAPLRRALLTAGRVEQIVDLPQGIWPDANVDCVLLFLAADADEQRRRDQMVTINLLHIRDTLDKLTTRAWTETLTQPQARWLDHPRAEINTRHDDLLQRIEDACRIPANGGTKVLRLGDVTDSTQGIIPYETQAETKVNPYIRPRHEVPVSEADWQPLLDSTSYIGRYDLRWGRRRPYLKYGSWLCRPRESRFFESPKLLVQDMRNRALRRRLVATFDDDQFFNRHNFSNIIVNDESFRLKYVLALFNSSLLNFWFARQYDNVHINPSYFRQLPVYPADAATQAALIELVDQLLATHAALNAFRERGYTIRRRADGAAVIEMPYDELLAALQQTDPTYPALTLFDAQAAGLLTIPDRCDLRATISSNVDIPERYPATLVLRHNKLWLEIADADRRRFLHGYLRRPRWRGRSWDEVKNQALVPADSAALAAFFASEARQRQQIVALLDEAARLDAAIDDRVLDLYGITDPADRQRILGSAPLSEDDEPADEGAGPVATPAEPDQP